MYYTGSREFVRVARARRGLIGGVSGKAEKKGAGGGSDSETARTRGGVVAAAQVGGDAGVGITAFAAEALGDVVFVDLPDVGSAFDKGESFGSVEASKTRRCRPGPLADSPESEKLPPGTSPSAASTEINEDLSDNPGLVNQSAIDDGWFVKIKVAADELGGLIRRRVAKFSERTRTERALSADPIEATRRRRRGGRRALGSRCRSRAVARARRV